MRYRPYIRTILLSVLAAIIIDAVVNFEDYKNGWMAARKKESVQEENTAFKVKLPVELGKASSLVFGFIFRT
jgi:hypothetical protein